MRLQGQGINPVQLESLKTEGETPKVSRPPGVHRGNAV